MKHGRVRPFATCPGARLEEFAVRGDAADSNQSFVPGIPPPRVLEGTGRVTAHIARLSGPQWAAAEPPDVVLPRHSPG